MLFGQHDAMGPSQSGFRRASTGAGSTTCGHSRPLTSTPGVAGMFPQESIFPTQRLKDTSLVLHPTGAAQVWPDSAGGGGSPRYEKTQQVGQHFADSKASPWKQEGSEAGHHRRAGLLEAAWPLCVLMKERGGGAGGVQQCRCGQKTPRSDQGSNPALTGPRHS